MALDEQKTFDVEAENMRLKKELAEKEKELEDSHWREKLLEEINRRYAKKWVQDMVQWMGIALASALFATIIINWILAHLNLPPG